MFFLLHNATSVAFQLLPILISINIFLHADDPHQHQMDNKMDNEPALFFAADEVVRF